MKTKDFSLTSNELQIMDLLWREGRGLSRAEIIELSPDRDWKASSIHILLNQLLAKEAIEVDGFVKTGKNYGRTFAATLSKDEYGKMELKKSVKRFALKPSVLGDFVATLFEEEDIDNDTLDRLDALLKEKRGKNL